jgi:glycosyltransferase involved in cell wall biosynthesis
VISKKNIAIFIDSLGGGGAEKVMLTLASGLKLAGHQVHFFLLESRIEYTPSQDFAVHILYSHVKHRKSANIFNIRQTVSDMQALVQDVTREHGEFDLHLANLDPTCKVLSRCHFNNTFYILHNAMAQELKREARLGPIKYLRKKREKSSYNNKNLIAVSDGVKNEALSEKYIKPKSVIRIYNPTDISEITQLISEPNNDIPKEPYLIHAGRVVKQKRHDILFQALALIPDIKLVLLCKYDKKARKIAAKYGVEDRIITPGFQENPYNWFANAQLLISSSGFEGLGMNLIDSLICQTPVVSTNCDYGPSEILTGEQAEFLVPLNDPEALASKIIQALKSPPKIDLEHIHRQFSIDSAVKAYLDLIK